MFSAVGENPVKQDWEILIGNCLGWKELHSYSQCPSSIDMEPPTHIFLSHTTTTQWPKSRCATMPAQIKAVATVVVLAQR